MSIQRPALHYFGGKWQLACWIISKFPKHDCYIEPFGGAASVLLQKPPSPVEIYNDLDGDVVNFFRVLRTREADLIRAIQLTPYSREEYQLSLKRSDPEAPLELARRFYVRSWQSISSNFSCPGWRNVFRPGHSVLRQWNDTQNLWAIAFRLKQVQIENQEAIKLIERTDTPETLFYVDPPYVKSTRRERRPAYKYELTDSQHQELATVLNAISGKAIVSGYDCPLYDKLYQGWEKVSILARKNFGTESTETLWIHPHCQINRQLSLFDSPENY